MRAPTRRPRLPLWRSLRAPGPPVLDAFYSHQLTFVSYLFFFFQAEDGIRDLTVTGVQTCALPIPMNKGAVPSQPNVWEHDQNSHGTHVTSTIIGYSFFGTPINGVAPKAKIIPVKVLKQSGFGWSSMIARGIVYITNLKMSGQLGSSPAVINMSLGGPSLDVEA